MACGVVSCHGRQRVGEEGRTTTGRQGTGCAFRWRLVALEPPTLPGGLAQVQGPQDNTPGRHLLSCEATPAWACLCQYLPTTGWCVQTPARPAASCKQRQQALLASTPHTRKPGLAGCRCSDRPACHPAAGGVATHTAAPEDGARSLVARHLEGGRSLSQARAVELPLLPASAPNRRCAPGGAAQV